MIDEYIISFESCSNSINATSGFNIKHILQKEKYWWIKMFNDIMVKKT
jgi:hypothetical protein